MNVVCMQAQVDSAPPPGINERLLEVVLATVPAILAYFLGWAYLHFYLSAFGFSESELDIGIQTIFVYAFPPIRLLLNSCWDWLLINWLWVLIILSAVFAMVWVCTRFLSPSAAHAVGRLVRRCGQLIPKSPLGQGVGTLLAVMALVFLTSPLIRKAAFAQADLKWVAEGVRLDAVLRESDAKERSATLVNYKTCSERRALDLIFADRSAYYLLCISSVDPSNAVVFEVRRDGGLASVRYVRRDHELGGAP
jgi:hypothetical protein